MVLGVTLAKYIGNTILKFKLTIKGHWRFYFFMKKHGGCYSLHEVATYLNISEDKVTTMVSHSQLLCFKLYFRRKFPVWQFKDDKVVSGFEQILRRLKYSSPFSQIRFFLCEDVELGMTPIAALRTNFNIHLLLNKADDFDMHTYS